MKNKRLVILLVILAGAFSALLLLTSGGQELMTSLARKYYGGSSQCVAFVQRYYNSMFGIEIKDVGRAQNLFTIAPEFGLYAHKNNSPVAPQPGDILVFGHKNKIGHVAIITDVLKDGVKIIEQNWGTSAITTNRNQPLPMTEKNGRFFLPDRESYWIIGWVSRTNRNPNKLFSFSNNKLGGWVMENSLRLNREDHSPLEMKVIGRNPSVLSPVFLSDSAISGTEKIEMKLRIENKNGQKGMGHLFLRDQNDAWTEDIPFAIDANQDFQDYSINLGDLPDYFKITQLRLQLNDKPQIGSELWQIRRLRIY